MTTCHRCCHERCMGANKLLLLDSGRQVTSFELWTAIIGPRTTPEKCFNTPIENALSTSLFSNQDSTEPRVPPAASKGFAESNPETKFAANRRVFWLLVTTTMYIYVCGPEPRQGSWQHSPDPLACCPLYKNHSRPSALNFVISLYTNFNNNYNYSYNYCY